MAPLSGLRTVESVAFAPTPHCGLSLAQLGADAIRRDPLEGALVARRRPWDRGSGKRSVAVNTRTPEGQERLTASIAREDEGGGLFCTAMGILVAERHRRLTGAGHSIELPSAVVALAMVGNLGGPETAEDPDSRHQAATRDTAGLDKSGPRARSGRLFG